MSLPTDSRPARRPTGSMVIALMSFFALAFVALFGERIAPHEPIFFVVEHGNDPRPYDPGLVFPFGSDVLGRDLFSLVLAGAGATLAIVLVGGVARVFAGALVAALGSWWSPARLVTDAVGELVSAVPATLVALVLVKVFVATDTSLLMFITALLVTGWAGPYRVIRSELDRLGSMPLTEGARALGVGPWRLFWRHHVPHLLPMVALNVSQQVVASLVLVAELGVLGVAIGRTRTINIEESLSRVLPTQVNVAQISDPPEWGGLLANARTIESLWTTRWLVLVPGIAFALTAIAVAAIGFALARRYGTRDVIDDLRRPGAAALAGALVVLLLVSSFVPQRYAAATEWAEAARAEVRATNDIERTFTEAGLIPLGRTFAVTAENATIVQTEPASATVGSVTVVEQLPRDPNRTAGSPLPLRPFVSGGTGGGVVEAPLVFAARGISALDYPPKPRQALQPRSLDDFAQLLDEQQWADDYAGIEVRGKVVLLVRFAGVTGRLRPLVNNGQTRGPAVDESIANAIKRGAAAVIFVDAALDLYTDVPFPATYSTRPEGIVAGDNPYLSLERRSPPVTTSGTPVVVVGADEAQTLVASLGLNIRSFIGLPDYRASELKASAARELGVTARVEVPLGRTPRGSTSYLGEVAGVGAETARVLVWAPHGPSPNPNRDVLGALARALGPRRVPFIFVAFDEAGDPKANGDSIRQLLRGRRIALVVVLERLDGGLLQVTTPYGDLIPALDAYAAEAGARHQTTYTTPPIGSLEGVAPFIEMKTVVLKGSGGEDDPRADAAAVVGYLAGRLALGAEELPR